MFKFVTANAGPSPQKRQQSQRACEPCRKRKKRCTHTAALQSANTQLDGMNGKRHSPVSAIQSSTDDAASNIVLQSEQLSQNGSDGPQSTWSPTVEGTNDQGVQTETIQRDNLHPQEKAVNPLPSRDSEALGSRFIGDLSPEGIFLAATSPNATRGGSLEHSIGIWLTGALNHGASQPTYAIPSVQSQSSLFYGSSPMVQKVLLPVLEQECLSALPPVVNFETLSKIYFEKIHPIFPVIDRNAVRASGQAEPSHILLHQAICLAASKNSAARDHLILAGSPSVLSCREFGSRMTGAMRLSIEIGLVTDRIILIQVLALMSQFVDSQDGGDLSSQLCARAIHHSQSIGLQIEGQQDEGQNQYGTTLLCCIWAMDRMNCAVYGRPILMHDRDIDRNLQECFSQQDPCFHLLLKVTQLLDAVIGLYRPLNHSTDTDLENNFPSFEELVEDCAALQLATPLLATLETLYNAVAILSCRNNSRANRQSASASYLRQNLSSLRLSSTIGLDVRERIVLFPFVPYAVSLALSIAYHKMRHEKIPLYRARARAQFQSNCDILSDLGEVFWSASSISEMGKKILKEMDRVFAVMSDTSCVRPQQPGLCHDITNLASPLSTSERPENLTSGSSTMQPSTVTMNATQTSSHPIQEGFTLDSMPDLDLFGMFAPDFDLNGIDACLGGILDPSFPMYPQ